MVQSRLWTLSILFCFVVLLVQTFAEFVFGLYSFCLYLCVLFIFFLFQGEGAVVGFRSRISVRLAGEGKLHNVEVRHAGRCHRRRSPCHQQGRLLCCGKALLSCVRVRTGDGSFPPLRPPMDTRKFERGSGRHSLPPRQEGIKEAGFTAAIRTLVVC